MTELNMTAERVLELIEAFGAAPGGWPEAERAAARALLEAQPDLFAAAIADARAVDDLLSEEVVPEPSLDLAQSILAQAPQVVPEQNNLIGVLGRVIFPQGARWPAGAVIASLFMGLVGGYSYASTGAGYDQADSAYYAAFGFDSGNAWLEAE
ncbi:MAG: hypothetical protein NXH72_09895 [Hyphomonadaceae bacterium]|nr:hypothetical protein [Hyphomonadaceae bacterium]